MIAAFLRDELRPSPGRTAAVGRMVVACLLTMLTVLLGRVPFGFLAVLFVLALPRADSRSTIRNGFDVIVATVAGAALALLAFTLFADEPLLYFLSVVVRLFLAFFLTRTLVSGSSAFGFSIILIAALVVWDRPGFTVEGQIETTVGTAIGMIVAILFAMGTEWAFAGASADSTTSRSGPASSMRSLFIEDAFSNPDHMTFALKGCLAATICYVFYSVLAWPGMAVCTVTCVLAAPAGRVGTAQRKMWMRLAGLLAGGVVLGLGSQALVLPLVDSILGFSLVFSVACAAIAWIATASPRLSYASRPMAMGYLLTVFQRSGVNPSLLVTRDRLMGVLLGIVVMWLVVDRDWSMPFQARLRLETR